MEDKTVHHTVFPRKGPSEHLQRSYPLEYLEAIDHWSVGVLKGTQDQPLVRIPAADEGEWCLVSSAASLRVQVDVGDPYLATGLRWDVSGGDHVRVVVQKAGEGDTVSVALEGFDLQWDPSLSERLPPGEEKPQLRARLEWLGHAPPPATATAVPPALEPLHLDVGHPDLLHELLVEGRLQGLVCAAGRRETLEFIDLCWRTSPLVAHSPPPQLTTLHAMLIFEVVVSDERPVAFVRTPCVLEPTEVLPWCLDPRAPSTLWGEALRAAFEVLNAAPVVVARRGWGSGSRSFEVRPTPPGTWKLWERPVVVVEGSSAGDDTDDDTLVDVWSLCLRSHFDPGLPAGGLVASSSNLDLLGPGDQGCMEVVRSIFFPGKGKRGRNSDHGDDHVGGGALPPSRGSVVVGTDPRGFVSFVEAVLGASSPLRCQHQTSLSSSSCSGLLGAIAAHSGTLFLDDDPAGLPQRGLLALGVWCRHGPNGDADDDDNDGDASLEEEEEEEEGDDDTPVLLVPVEACSNLVGVGGLRVCGIPFLNPMLCGDSTVDLDMDLAGVSRSAKHLVATMGSLLASGRVEPCATIHAEPHDPLLRYCCRAYDFALGLCDGGAAADMEGDSSDASLLLGPASTVLSLTAEQRGVAAAVLRRALAPPAAQGRRCPHFVRLEGGPGSGRTTALLAASLDVVCSVAPGPVLFLSGSHDALDSAAMAMDRAAKASISVCLSHGEARVVSQLNDMLSSILSDGTSRTTSATAATTTAARRTAIQPAASSSQFVLQRFQESRARELERCESEVLAAVKARRTADCIYADPGIADAAGKLREYVRTPSAEALLLLVRHPGWTRLVQVLAPVVFATSEALTFWLGQSPRAGEGGFAVPTWPLVVIDDISATGFSMADLALPCALFDARAVVLSGEHKGKAAAAITSALAPTNPATVVLTRGGSGNHHHIPFSSLLMGALGTDRVRLHSSGLWKPARLGGRIADVLEAVRGAVEAVSAGAQTSIADSVLASIYDRVKTLRAALVNTAEATAVLTEVFRIHGRLQAPSATYGVVTMNDDSAVFVEVCLAVLKPPQGAATIKVRSLEAGLSGFDCDVALVSLLFSPGARQFRQTLGRRHAQGVGHVLEHIGAWQVHFFMSGTPQAWRSTPKQWFRRAQASITAATKKAGSGSGGGGEQHQQGDDDDEEAEEEEQQQQQEAWVRSLFVRLEGLKTTSRAPLHDASLGKVVWRGQHISCILNYHCIVLCHSRPLHSGAEEEAAVLALELPRALARFGWARVIHVFQGDVVAAAATQGQDGVNFAPGVCEQILADICSWQQSLCDACSVVDVATDSAQLSVSVDPRHIPASILRSLSLWVLRRGSRVPRRVPLLVGGALQAQGGDSDAAGGNLARALSLAGLKPGMEYALEVRDHLEYLYQALTIQTRPAPPSPPVLLFSSSSKTTGLANVTITVGMSGALNDAEVTITCEVLPEFGGDPVTMAQSTDPFDSPRVTRTLAFTSLGPGTFLLRLTATNSAGEAQATAALVVDQEPETEEDMSEDGSDPLGPFAFRDDDNEFARDSYDDADSDDREALGSDEDGDGFHLMDVDGESEGGGDDAMAAPELVLFRNEEGVDMVSITTTVPDPAFDIHARLWRASDSNEPWRVVAERTEVRTLGVCHIVREAMQQSKRPSPETPAAIHIRARRASDGSPWRTLVVPSSEVQGLEELARGLTTLAEGEFPLVVRKVRLTPDCGGSCVASVASGEGFDLSLTLGVDPEALERCGGAHKLRCLRMYDLAVECSLCVVTVAAAEGSGGGETLLAVPLDVELDLELFRCFRKAVTDGKHVESGSVFVPLEDHASGTLASLHALAGATIAGEGQGEESLAFQLRFTFTAFHTHRGAEVALGTHILVLPPQMCFGDDLSIAVAPSALSSSHPLVMRCVDEVRAGAGASGGGCGDDGDSANAVDLRELEASVKRACRHALETSRAASAEVWRGHIHTDTTDRGGSEEGHHKHHPITSEASLWAAVAEALGGTEVGRLVEYLVYLRMRSLPVGSTIAVAAAPASGRQQWRLGSLPRIVEPELEGWGQAWMQQSRTLLVEGGGAGGASWAITELLGGHLAAGSSVMLLQSSGVNGMHECGCDCDCDCGKKKQEEPAVDDPTLLRFAVRGLVAMEDLQQTTAFGWNLPLGCDEDSNLVFLGLGHVANTPQGHAAIVRGGGGVGWGQHHEFSPLVLVPVMVQGTVVSPVPGTQPFINPALSARYPAVPTDSGPGTATPVLPLRDWASELLGDACWRDVAAGGFSLVAVPRNTKLSQAPALQFLLHHGLWSRVSAGAYRKVAVGGGGSSPSSTSTVSGDGTGSGTDLLGAWRAQNPLQLGAADESQRRAISRALSGDSFVVRGPPGCGKTQTLSNMVAALVAQGKRVLVVAKMPIALQCVEDKLRKLVPGERALRCLSTSSFMARSGSRFKPATDPTHGVLGNSTIKAWQLGVDASAFFDGCAIRSMLEEGEWERALPVPAALEDLASTHGLPCALLVPTAESSAPKSKRKYVCGLCGKEASTESPFLKHMHKHAARSLWAPEYQDRLLRRHPPGEPSLPAQIHAEALRRQAETTARLDAVDAELCEVERVMHEALGDHPPGGAARCCPCCPGTGSCFLSATPAIDLAGRILLEDPALGAPECLTFAEGACARAAAGCPWCAEHKTHWVLEHVRVLKSSAATCGRVGALSFLDGAMENLDGASGGSCGGSCALGLMQELKDRIFAGSSGAGTTEIEGEAGDASEAFGRTVVRYCAVLEHVYALAWLQRKQGGSTAGSFGSLVAVPGLVERFRGLHERRLGLCRDLLRCRVRAEVCGNCDAYPGLKEVFSSDNIKCAGELQHGGGLGAGVGGGSSASVTANAVKVGLRGLARLQRVRAAASAGGESSGGAGGAGAWSALPPSLELVLSALPVVLMTPEQVRAHLPAFARCPPALGFRGAEALFDCILLDEASQMPTVEALPCLGLARQCIIIGDDKQLPPRSGMQGLLDDCLNKTQGSIPLVPLQLHYRSGDPSLIDVSNELFYHGSLTSFPSAHQLTASAALAEPHLASASSAVVGGHGLQRVCVANGFLESNYERRKDVEEAIEEAIHDTLGASKSVSYSSSPQGYINVEQATGIFRDLVTYLRDVNDAGKAMSIGIITLNRPQRALINTMVSSTREDLGLVPLGGGAESVSGIVGYLRVEGLRRDDDDVLFIQSIDQIQGEERDVILLSTLLAPKYGTGSTASVGATTTSEDPGEDVLDHLEAAATDGVDGDGDDSGGGGDDGEFSDSLGNEGRDQEEAAPPRTPSAKSRAKAPPSSRGVRFNHGRRMHFSYSTLSHPHGDRLLNVGLTRAVRTMRVYFHPDTPTPPEHDPKPGKRAFGWFIRYLTNVAPACACNECTARFAKLSQGLQQNGSSPASASTALAGGSPLNALVCRALGQSPGVSSTEVMPPAHGTASSVEVDLVVRRPRATAVTLMEAASGDLRDRFLMTPAVLTDPKLGWEGGVLTFSLGTLMRRGLERLNDLMSRSACAPLDVMQCLRGEVGSCIEDLLLLQGKSGSRAAGESVDALCDMLGGMGIAGAGDAWMRDLCSAFSATAYRTLEPAVVHVSGGGGGEVLRSEGPGESRETETAVVADSLGVLPPPPARFKMRTLWRPSHTHRIGHCVHCAAGLDEKHALVAPGHGQFLVCRVCKSDKEAAAAVQKVLAALKKQGMPEDDIMATRFPLGDGYREEEGGGVQEEKGEEGAEELEPPPRPTPLPPAFSLEEDEDDDEEEEASTASQSPCRESPITVLASSSRTSSPTDSGGVEEVQAAKPVVTVTTATRRRKNKKMATAATSLARGAYGDYSDGEDSEAGSSMDGFIVSDEEEEGEQEEDSADEDEHARRWELDDNDDEELSELMARKLPGLASIVGGGAAEDGGESDNGEEEEEDVQEQERSVASLVSLCDTDEED